MLFGCKAEPLHEKKTGCIASRIWKRMPPETADFSLQCLFEQARQSNSKGGSPAEPLILNNLNDLGGGSIMQRFFGRVSCGTKTNHWIQKAWALNTRPRLKYLSNLEIDATQNNRFLITLLIRTGEAIKFEKGVIQQSP